MVKILSINLVSKIYLTIIVLLAISLLGSSLVFGQEEKQNKKEEARAPQIYTDQILVKLDKNTSKELRKFTKGKDKLLKEDLKESSRTAELLDKTEAKDLKALKSVSQDEDTSTDLADIERWFVISLSSDKKIAKKDSDEYKKLEEKAESIRKIEGVEDVNLNYVLTADLYPNDPYFNEINNYSYGVRKIKAPYAWNDGIPGVKVAVLDTGIKNTHSDFAGHIVSNIDFTGSSYGSDDIHGHGTHVAGTVGTVVNNYNGVTGVYPGSQLMNVKIIGDSGSASLETLNSGIIWAADNGAKVLNMSLGAIGSCPTSAQDSVNYAYVSKYAVLVGSAGNSNINAVDWPANCNNVISVAATDSNDARAGFSNYGTAVDIAAPGVNIYSTTKDLAYNYMSGTSMAAPHVSGAAAAIWSKPGMTTPGPVVNALLSNADPIPGTGSYWSNGRLNLGKAYYGSALKKTKFDFGYDNKADFIVFRKSTAYWYNNSNPYAYATLWGDGNDIPAAADYDGDGATDIAVYGTYTGYWKIYPNGTPIQWGQYGDIPVPGDYNGDGKADIAVYRPSNGFWYVAGIMNVQYGQPGDIPVPADYNGDGIMDIGVYRPSNGMWYIAGVVEWLQYGQSGDIPVAGDYNGDGIAEVGVYRPSNGYWFIRGVIENLQYGAAGDVPVPADYDGNGTMDIGVYRPSNGYWFIRGIAEWVQWGGDPSDIPPARKSY